MTIDVSAAHSDPLRDERRPRVLVVDDDVELSTMLREYLESEGFDVGVEANGRAGLSGALSGLYDVVILDIMLPFINGMDVLQRIRIESQIPVIMLTAKGDDVERVLGLECGADDYLAKPYYAREVVARIRAILRRRPTFEGAQPTVLSFGPLAANTETRCGFLDGRLLQLTTSEFKILVGLLRSSSSVSTKEYLSEKVLGRSWKPYDRSIDVHVSNMRQKIGGGGSGVEIETVWGLGYRLRLPC